MARRRLPACPYAAHHGFLIGVALSLLIALADAVFDIPALQGRQVVPKAGNAAVVPHVGQRLALASRIGDRRDRRRRHWRDSRQGREAPPRNRARCCTSEVLPVICVCGLVTLDVPLLHDSEVAGCAIDANGIPQSHASGAAACNSSSEHRGHQRYAWRKRPGLSYGALIHYDGIARHLRMQGRCKQRIQQQAAGGRECAHFAFSEHSNDDQSGAHTRPRPLNACALPHPSLWRAGASCPRRASTGST